jgi:hypothetical protein
MRTDERNSKEIISRINMMDSHASRAMKNTLERMESKG